MAGRKGMAGALIVLAVTGAAGQAKAWDFVSVSERKLVS